MKGVISSIRTMRWTKLTAGLLGLAMACMLVFSPIANALGDKVDSSSRLVTFYDDGVEKTIITKGKTVRQALADADIKLNDNDKIDPGVDSALSDSMSVVNIRRARPITVVDEGRNIRVVTAATDNASIAREADATLKAHDTAKMAQIDDFIAAGGAGQEMKITRAKTANILLYGQKISLRTQQTTVALMLREAGIKLASNDSVSVDLNTPVTDGMSFQIWRNGIQTIEQTEDVPFNVKKIDDSTKKVGYHEVQTPGQVGKKTVIYQVNMINGQEVGRQKISEVITVPAVDQVEINGTKVELPPGSHADWMRMAGISESDFGYVNYIVSKESGWNPLSRNKSSGACGLPQALPCSKMSKAGSDYATNPVTQLKWMTSYVSRYGGWKGAYDFWQAHHWY